MEGSSAPTPFGVSGMAATPEQLVMLRYAMIGWGYGCLAFLVTVLVLLLLPSALAGGLPKPLRALRQRLRGYWRRGLELSADGPFFRFAIWLGRRLSQGKIASRPRAPELRAKAMGCSEAQVTLAPSLPRNPFHEENYVIAWSLASGKEDWREKPCKKDEDFEKVGAKLRTFVDQLPERTAVKVRACSHNAWGRSEWSKAATVETFARPSREGGFTGPLAPSFGSQYTWTQNRIELWVKIPVPAALKARDIRFKCTGPRLEVRWAEGGSDKLTDILVGALFDKVKGDEVFWTIEDEDKKLGRHLAIQLAKAEHLKKWPCLIDAEGHTKVDVRLIQFFTGENETFSDLSALNVR